MESCLPAMDSAIKKSHNIHYAKLWKSMWKTRRDAKKPYKYWRGAKSLLDETYYTYSHLIPSARYYVHFNICYDTPFRGSILCLWLPLIFGGSICFKIREAVWSPSMYPRNGYNTVFVKYPVLPPRKTVPEAVCQHQKSYACTHYCMPILRLLFLSTQSC